jgi:trehalose 6-phosphate phosphatase
VRVEDVPAAIAGRAERAGVFLDLDGTLAPIVERPELARVLPDVPGILERLAARLAVVAVISGRPSEEVRALVGVEGVVAVGTHGLEAVDPMDPAVIRAVEQVAAGVGAWVERKGAAVAVHFRGLDDPEAAATAAEPGLAAVAAAYGLGIVPGKRILELVPMGRPRKGGALERIVREHGLEAILFAGDDVGDLDAFASLARLADEGIWTCSVAVRGSETPAEVEAASDLAVDGPVGIAGLLVTIADALDRPA